MTSFRGFGSLVLAAAIVSTLSAETHCPGNVASVPFQGVNSYQIVLPVSVNHTGPYNFLLDTGTQVTMIDPTLATELHLSAQGTAIVAGAGFHALASFAQLERLEAGSHAVANPKVLVYNLRRLRSTVVNVVGILGEDFLEHFDMLIDNTHSLLCLDDTGAVRESIKGSHIPLLTSTQTGDGMALPKSLIVAVRLSAGMRPVRLMLDSGTNTPILYNTSKYMSLGLFRGKPLSGAGLNGASRVFSALPPQTVKIGSLQVPEVQFFTLGSAEKDSRTSDFDGLLTLGLFRRVFIDHADHFVIFDPK